MHHLKSRRRRGAGDEGRRAIVGAVIMLGTLVGLIVLIFGLVLRFDPEARNPSKREGREP
jgi:hypothetical protein